MDINTLIINAIDNPVRAIGITEVNYIADKIIKSAVLQTAGLSFLAGLPGGVWGIAAAGPDIVQNLAYYIILSQKLAYVYGVNFYETAFPTDSEYQKSSTLLCLGFMLGVNDVDSLIQKVLGGAWKNSGKEFVEFLMKTAGFALARKILTSIGERLANKGATNVLGKAVPLLGGLLSGGIGVQRGFVEGIVTLIAKNFYRVVENCYLCASKKLTQNATVQLPQSDIEDRQGTVFAASAPVDFLGRGQEYYWQCR